MRLPIPCRRPSWAFVLLAFAAVGCGLGSYEEEMLKAQQNLDYFDREDKELASPLEIPEAVQKYAEEVFLRVPKGVSTTADTGNPVSGLFYRYAGSKDISALYVAWPAEKEKPAAFAARVRGASLFNNAGQKAFQYTTVPAPGRKSLTLNATTFELADRTYHVYLDPDQKVAIGFEVSRNVLARTATDTINLSLGTLALGSDALKRAKEYRNRTKKAKK